MPISNFVGSPVIARKSFREILEIVKKAQGDKAIEKNAKERDCQKGEGGELAAADQRHLNTKASIDKVENDWR
jgi:hypothetical protein